MCELTQNVVIMFKSYQELSNYVAATTAATTVTSLHMDVCKLGWISERMGNYIRDLKKTY